MAVNGNGMLPRSHETSSRDPSFRVSFGVFVFGLLILGSILVFGNTFLEGKLRSVSLLGNPIFILAAFSMGVGRSLAMFRERIGKRSLTLSSFLFGEEPIRYDPEIAEADRKAAKEAAEADRKAELEKAMAVARIQAESEERSRRYEADSLQETEIRKAEIEADLERERLRRQ